MKIKRLLHIANIAQAFAKSASALKNSDHLRRDGLFYLTGRDVSCYSG
jgi:hypothetical protein